MTKTSYSYLSHIGISCYLPHLRKWPLKNGDKITWNLDNGASNRTVFSVVLRGTEWEADDSAPLAYKYNKYSLRSEILTVILTHAKQSYSGKHWCGSVSEKATARSKDIQLDIAGNT